MSTTIDEKVVAMKFDNAQFERGVSKTISSLDGLKKGLNLEGAAKGLQGIAGAVRNFDLSPITQGLDFITAKFSALGVIGVGALVAIGNKAFAIGSQLISSLTIDPVKAGLDEYETKLGSIQTILANTSGENTSLDQVTATLDKLNEYSDQTIYNFQEMTRNIGTFTAAGVSLDTSANAIKGIANLAAVSGSTSQQASSAMYQLSQALAAGKVSLMDWNSVVNAGMGGKVFQDALMETARVHGVAIDQIVADSGSFRGSLEKGWLSSEILTDTLMKFTGDLTDAQLESMGYTREQIAEIQKMAKTANDAATKVKTFSQLMSTLQESAQSGWAKTWEIVFGDFEEAKELWTSVNDTLGAMIGASADARNKMLEDWKALGGRTVLIDAMKNAWEALMSVVEPIQEAFREIFPPTTGKQLYDITVALRDFLGSLKLTGPAADNLKSTFKGLFALLDIGWMVIKQVVGVFARLFGSVSSGGDSFLEVTGNIGDFIVKVRDAIKNGDGLANVFKVIGDILEKPITLLKKFGQATVDWVNIESIAQLWERVGAALAKIGEFLGPVVKGVADGIGRIVEAVKGAFEASDPTLLVGALNAGLLGGIGLLIMKVIKMIKDGIGIDLTGGLFDTIKEAFGGLTDTMTAMQNKIKSDILIKIATAIAILTASLVVLSLLDTDKLAVSLAAITIMLGQLMAALEIFTRIAGPAQVAKMTGLAAALIILSTAMVIFASAVAIMASLSWDELARGLVGMAGALAIMLVSVKAMGEGSKGMVKGAASILIFSVALNAMASALLMLGSLSWEEIARAFVALAGSMLIVMAASKMAESSAQGAAAMFIISAALMVLGAALLVMAKMDWDEIARALATLAGSLLVMAVGVNAMSGSIAGAAAMAIVAVGVTILAQAFQEFAKLSWDDIGRSMVALAGGLLILAGGLYLMTGSIVGAAALLVATAALNLLVPVLIALGAMSWEAIGTGLGALAAALGIIAAGGILMIAAVPGLLGLGAAILMIGAGAVLAGIGMAAFAVGLATLSTVGPLAAEAIKMAVMTLIGLIPMALTALANGIIQFAVTIAQGGVEITAAFVTVLTSMITAIGTVGPLIVETLFSLIMMLVQTLLDNVPKLVDSGLKLLIGILQGIANNIGRIVSVATSIIVNFIDGIGRGLPRIIQAGVTLIINFVNGLANAIRDNTARMEAAGRNLASAIIDGMVGGISRGIQSVINAAKEVASAALNAAKNFLGIKSPSREFKKLGAWSTEGMAIGLKTTAGVVGQAAEGVGQSAVTSLKKSLAGLASMRPSDINIAPVIRPVLDLSAVKKDASKLGAYLPDPRLTLSDTNASARAAYEAYRATQDVQTNGQGASSEAPVREVHYNQTINSPKALSNAEIYRQSKNLISKAKEEVP